MEIVHRLQQGDSTGMGAGTCTCINIGGSTGTGRSRGASAQGMDYHLTIDGLVRL